MWNGSRSGPRGGMPFRGEPRGGMFDGRDGPRPDFRGRDGMNMDRPPMNMDRPPMDMRRFDCPPDMRGRDMGLLDRGREPPRDFFRPGDDMDMNFRRRFEMDQRNNLQNSPGFMGSPMDMGRRDMQPGNMRGQDDGFMNMRERFPMDAPGLPPMDIRRRLAMVAMGGNDNFGDFRDRERSRMGGIDGFNMDMPPRDRPMMDFERRGGGPSLNPRGRFESDMDMRNRMGSSGEFRNQPPQVFRNNEGIPMDVRGRPDMPFGCGGPESMNRAEELTLRDREFPEPMGDPMGFRGRESNSPFDEMRMHGMRDRDSLTSVNRTPPLFPKDLQERFLPNHGKDGDHSQFRDRQSVSGFQGKDNNSFNRSERDPKSQNWDKNVPSDFPGRTSTQASQKPPLLPLDSALNVQNREGDKLWPGDRDEKHDRIAPPDGRPPFHQGKNPPNQKSRFGSDRGTFKGSGDVALDQGPQRASLISGPKESQSSKVERQDQDYRDIDYRTSSGRKFDYNLEDFQVPQKDEKESKLAPPPGQDDSGSKDQDYRSASVQDKVSKTIAISGIPKTATMQQILNAFAVRDGVPMQGMKIRNVVPGYSFDTAYVEFLNLEDAVHFMESNQGSVKVGDKTALLKYIQPDKNAKEQHHEVPTKAAPASEGGLLPNPVPSASLKVEDETSVKPVQDPVSQSAWQRNSNLTPEEWQQQVDQQLQKQEAEQQAEDWSNQRSPRPNSSVFKESKTMIIKNILPTTTVEIILKALDQFAYLDERNVRLVKGKLPGSKCFCFVDMDSHEHVTRLVDLLTNPRPIMIDGVRVYAEVAKPLKNQNYRRESDKPKTSLLGFPPDVVMQQQSQNQQPQFYSHLPHTAVAPSMQGDPVGMDNVSSSSAMQSSSGVMYCETPALAQPIQPAEHRPSALPDPSLPGAADTSDSFSYEKDSCTGFERHEGSDDPDLSAFLYDATSGFYYDPQTTLYYDPNSRYFYNAQNQQYLYWDSTSKTYIPVENSDIPETAPEAGVPMATGGEVMATTITEEEIKTVTETGPARADEELVSRTEKKDKEKEEKPKTLAAFKIMKDMERWAKIQNRQKDSVRSPSPLLKTGDEQRPSKAADAAFAIFERKVTGGDDLFKKPLTPLKKDEKASKRPMGSLGMLAADYGAGSDEEDEEKHEKQEAPRPSKSQPQEKDEKEDRLTDWKKMACLLCRRQFPNKDSLIRHQQLSDLHKQNMEIHLKIKRSKRELEALENQEKELKMKASPTSNSPPEAKRRKPANTWSSGSRDSHKGSERPGLGLETERKKKEPVVWNHATYKQAVRKAMFARFNELD